MGMERSTGITKENQKVSQRLWRANEVNLRLAVGNIEVAGKENIKGIPPGAKVVIITTHLTDLDVPLAIHAVARDLDIAVMNLSIHHQFFGKQGEAVTNIGVRLAGKENFIPLDYHRDESGEKSPTAFNPENFEPAIKTLEGGKGILIAAHNPSREPLQNLENVKGGYGGVYLAELADAYILPITVLLDRAAGMQANMLKTVMHKPNASVSIGKPFKLEKIDGIERIANIMKKRRDGEKLSEEEIKEFSRLTNALREQSQAVIKQLSEQLATQNS
jgi:hypothetical protein